MTKKALVALAVHFTAAIGAASERPDTDPLAPTGRWTANSRGAAATPPMGWNSWNAFGTLVNEEKVLGAAAALVDSGLAELGYRYVNIDDGWWLKRRQPDGRVLIRTSIFPSADTGPDTSFRPFTDRLHDLGLKAGIYTDVGCNACSQTYDIDSPNLPEGEGAEREVGLMNHVDQDIALFFDEWGFDFVKVDACGIDTYGPNSEPVLERGYRMVPPMFDRSSINRTDVAGVRRLYARVADALERTNPDGDYVFSVCNWGAANVRQWGKDVGNTFRVSEDIRPTWSRMLHCFDAAASRPLYAQPGSWNDPDMLFVGTGDFDEDHLTEARTHFTLWAVVNAPLLIGYDLREAPESLLEIWGNPDLVAANQDPAGHQAVVTYDSDDVQILVKTLADFDRQIVVLFNRGVAPLDVTLLPAHMRLASDQPIVLRDLWTNEAPQTHTGERTFRVEARGSLAFEARGTRSLSDGMYLTQLPGNVNIAVDGVVAPAADPTPHRMTDPWGGTRSIGSRPIYGGWGGAQADASPHGQTLQVAGAKFQTGVGILANSRIEVRRPEGFTTFTAKVGVDDNTANLDTAVVFEVYADGKLTTKTPPLRFGDEALAIVSDIHDAKIVELVTRQASEPKRPVTVTWAEAALLKDSP